MSGNTIAVLSGVGTLVLGVLTLLVVRVDERSALARIWAWLQKSRKEREALERRIGELDKHINLLSALVQTQSKMRDAEHRELESLVAALKKRADADGKRLTNAEENIIDHAEGFDALSTELKQVEKQLVDYAGMLQEAHEQINESHRKADDLLAGNATLHGALDRRLRKLEGRPPAGYQGKVPVSDSRDPGSAES